MRSGSYNKMVLFYFDQSNTQYGHQIGHEHKICGNEYQILRFGIIYSCDISKHAFIGSGSSKNTFLPL